MANEFPLLLSGLEGAAIEARSRRRGGMRLLLPGDGAPEVELVRESEAYEWKYVGPLRLTTDQPGRGIVGKSLAVERDREDLARLSRQWLAEASRVRQEDPWCRGLVVTGGHREGADTVVDVVATIATVRWYFYRDPAGQLFLLCGDYGLHVTNDDFATLRAAAGGVVARVQDALSAVAGIGGRRELSAALNSGGASAQEHLDEIRSLLQNGDLGTENDVE